VLWAYSVAKADADGPFGIMVLTGGTPGATISKYASRPVSRSAVSTAAGEVDDDPAGLPVGQAAQLLAEGGYGRAAELAGDRRDGVAALAADGK
jgi:hypothetical protein